MGRRLQAAVLCALLAVGLGANQATPASPMRVWVDEHRYLPTTNDVLYRAINDTGGRAVLVGKSRGPQEEGHLFLHKMDIYWSSGSRGAIAHNLQATADLGVRINQLPGLATSCVSKDRMVAVLRKTYGAQAFSIIPPSFRLPKDAADLEAYVDSKEGAGADWVAKQLRHRGEGVRMLRGRDVLRHKQLSAEADLPYVLAQRLVEPQFRFLGGRTVKLRVTVLVMGIRPAVRVYVLTDGAVMVSAPGPAAGGELLVVNSHQRGARFMTHLELRSLADAACGGPEAWDGMWEAAVRQIAALVAMAGDEVVRYRQQLPGAAGGFELLGVDVLLDEQLMPWVIEVNNDPEFTVDPDSWANPDPSFLHDIFGGTMEMLLLAHGARARNVSHDAWAPGSKWVRHEERIARAHRLRPIGDLVLETYACGKRLQGGGSGGCEVLGAGRAARGARACALRPLEDALLGSIAACPA